jgi:hypothetical protein
MTLNSSFKNKILKILIEPETSQRILKKKTLKLSIQKPFTEDVLRLESENPITLRFFNVIQNRTYPEDLFCE